MFIDEPNQDVQPEQETEQEDDSSESESSDPFDTLSEAEIRAEAKKLRAINARKKETRETNHGDDVVRRSDFERANEAKARTKLRDRGDAMSKEILEHWDSLASVYGKVASRGKNSEDDIIEDLFDAHAVWKRTNAPKSDTTKEAAADVAALAGTGGTAPLESTPKRDRIIKSQSGIGDWYKS